MKALFLGRSLIGFRYYSRFSPVGRWYPCSCVIPRRRCLTGSGIGHRFLDHLNVRLSMNVQTRSFSADSSTDSSSSSHDSGSTVRFQPDPLTDLEYEHVADHTLDSLWDVFDRLPEDMNGKIGSDYDVSYSQGVLTVKLDGKRGTYVINKQSPNKQIWLSSPFSGPKRYDMVGRRWIYSHDGMALHELLNKEIRHVFRTDSIDFTKCAYG